MIHSLDNARRQARWDWNDAEAALIRAQTAIHNRRWGGTPGTLAALTEAVALALRAYEAAHAAWVAKRCEGEAALIVDGYAVRCGMLRSPAEIDRWDAQRALAHAQTSGTTPTMAD